MKKLLLSMASMALFIGANAQDKVYFSEDFEWFANCPSAVLVDGFPSDNQNCSPYAISKAADETSSLYDKFLEKGYSFVGCKQSSMADLETKTFIYAQQNYLKFGKKGYFAGIVFPKAEAYGNGVENVKLSFNWVSNRRDDGTYDPTKLVVIVKNGADEKVFDVEPKILEDNAPLSWFSTTVDLSGVTITKDSEITLRPCDDQFPAPDKVNYRWYLDNVKFFTSSSSVFELAESEVSEIEYYNLQGAKVKNPENGLYIVKKGNKVFKQIIR